MSRRPVGTVRLGYDAESALLVDERRRAAGSAASLRDAWQPTAGATGNRHRIALSPGDRVAAADAAAARAAAATCRRSG